MANPYKDDLEKLSTIYGRAKERYRDDSMNLEGCGQKVRELIHKHIRSSGIEVLNDEPVSVMEEGEFEERLDRLDDNDARASEMQHAIKHEINVRYDEDPVHYGSLRERVEELIEQYKQKRLTDQEIIEELRDVLNEMRERDQEARAKGLEDETELSFYHALEDVITAEGRDIDEETLIGLTADIVDEIEELVTVVEWKKKIGVQQQMRKNVLHHFLSGYYTFKSLTTTLAEDSPNPEFEGRVKDRRDEFAQKETSRMILGLRHYI